tara:strand:- start:870 stop:1115 length:246 start_codon:yes stop_codon:yes gene_type:complete
VLGHGFLKSFHCLWILLELQLCASLSVQGLPNLFKVASYRPTHFHRLVALRDNLLKFLASKVNRSPVEAINNVGGIQLDSF